LLGDGGWMLFTAGLVRGLASLVWPKVAITLTA